MTLQGPSRTYLLVKVLADDASMHRGSYGTRRRRQEQILSMKPGWLAPIRSKSTPSTTLLDEHVRDSGGTRTDGSATT